MGLASPMRCEMHVTLTCENSRSDTQIPLPTLHPTSHMIPVGQTTYHALFDKIYRVDSLLVTPLSVQEQQMFVYYRKWVNMLQIRLQTKLNKCISLSTFSTSSSPASSSSSTSASPSPTQKCFDSVSSFSRPSHGVTVV